MSSPNKLPASVLFHRALITLIPAMTLSLVAYNAGFVWYWVVPAIPFWAVGIWYLKRGSDRWKEEQH